jgi:hypothetical protein
MRSLKLAAALVALGVSACQVVPQVRDTTQPDRVAKSALRCGDSKKEWSRCEVEAPAEWYFRPTVIDAPYEAWWTFVGEQGETYKIVWEITQNSLIAYRKNEAFKGADGSMTVDPNYRAEPIAAWPITSHFDVWYQYNPSTGEQLPVLFEAQERPWYEREFIRVDWSANQIAGYGFFMGSKLTAVLDPQALKTEPARSFVNNPSDPDYRIITDDYLDVVTREVHTPMTVSGMDGSYFSAQPVSEVAYRYAFLLAGERDYDAFYYPDAAFEKFGFFRHEREVYDAQRGVTDFKDYLMNRWNLWNKVHSDVKCSAHTECGGGAETGVTCDLHERDADGKGRCTLPYTARGVRPITYYLAGNIPAHRAAGYTTQSCMVAQGWNIAYKQVLAKLLNKSYTPPVLDDQFAATCTFASFKAPPASGEFDPAVHDVFLLKEDSKSCDRNGHPATADTPESERRMCARIGDLRHSMIYYVDQPSSGSPLGYGPVASDPFTGEIIQGNAFMYGGALESYSSYIRDVVDLVDEKLTEEQFRAGENVREYYENQSGNVFPPTVPQNGFRLADLEMLESLKNGGLGERASKDRLDLLKKLSPEARNPFATKLRGTWIERLLVDNDEWKLAHGVDATHSLTDAELDKLSPFRPGWRAAVRREQSMESLLSHSKNCVFRANEYTDATVTWMVERYKAAGALGSAEIVSRIMDEVYRGVTEHEVGHNMGLRHNFEASFDRDNYFAPYYELLDRPGLADPDPVSFSGKTPKALPLTPDEFAEFDAARTAARKARDRQGAKMFQYSSIMDYGGQFYSDFRGLGRYDVAALKFGYGRTVEVFDGDPNQTRTNRLDRTWYLGGEKCESDTQCPYQGVGQTCVPGARDPSRKVCSSFDQDAALDDDHPPAKYRFCSDERVADRPFCNRFDEGASSLEIVENLIESYDRNYVFNNFRRYRRFFGSSYGGRIWSRYYEMMGKQFASLLYQLYYNQSSVLSSGAGSFSDMLSASVKAMNFFTRVLTTPDVGSYRKEALEQLPDGTQRSRYVRYSSNCRDDDADFQACLGVGKHFYSVWETGYYGALQRQARSGTYVDKQLAILALTNRDWGNPQANDETYPLSYYDGFQGEMLKLFSGIISSDVRKYAPVIRQDPATNTSKLVYRDVWSGSFFGTAARNFDYNRAPIVEYPGNADTDTRYDRESILDPEGRSPFIRFLALVYSLQGWQNIFDQTYADYLQIYTFGGPQVRFPADCTPTSTSCQVVAYESPIRKKTYMAVQTPDRKSIIFPLVKQAADLKLRYDHYYAMTPAEAEAEQVRAKNASLCRFNTTPDDWSCRGRLLEDLEAELTDRESFLNVAEEVTRLLGLNL